MGSKRNHRKGKHDLLFKVDRGFVSPTGEAHGRPTRKIHHTAIVHPSARLGAGVEIGPYCVIGPDVAIGDGTKIGAHVVIHGPCEIGKNCVLSPFVCLGGDPQDIKYKGEKTGLIIGDENVIREFVTIHRGTPEGRGETRVGNRNTIMTYAHIAHDCIVGSGVTITAGAALAGHVIVEDEAVLGGMCGIHQFCRVGRLAMVGGMAKVVKDVPPFALVDGNPARVMGLNIVGMRRHGLSSETRATLRKAYRILYNSGLTVSQANHKIAQELSSCPEIASLIDFLNGSSRGIMSYKDQGGYKDHGEGPSEQ
ncbi:MAG TPA: acyl-ACP--UDP-N-acetylglucosamine O-acyltransferase [Firmicutes bacterium]|nr:acyl-ACP--UDP-N-acetylglucosamine O-acyltransferase [Bacillota bacterium]